jgi:hypothetical protein
MDANHSPDPETPEPQPSGPRLPVSAAWRTALREFVLIVAGVLVALTGNSWWESRQDERREDVYLRQLASDLEESERLLEEGISMTRGYYIGAANVLRAFHAAEPPPADSLARWIAASDGYQNPQVVLGTVRGLIASGELRLIRDSQIRSAVLAYAQHADEYEGEGRDMTAEFLRYIGQVAEYVNLLEVRYAELDSLELDAGSQANESFPYPAGSRRGAFLNNYPRLLTNRGVFGLYDNIHITQQNLLRNQEVILARTRALRAQIKAGVGE